MFRYSCLCAVICLVVTSSLPAAHPESAKNNKRLETRRAPSAATVTAQDARRTTEAADLTRIPSIVEQVTMTAAAPIPVAAPSQELHVEPAAQHVQNVYTNPDCVQPPCVQPCSRCGARYRPCICRLGKPDYWGYSGSYEQPPLGWALNTAMQLQIDHGQAARMSLHHYDFYAVDDDRAAQLTTYGHIRLARLLADFNDGPHPLMIQPTGLPELDVARRDYVLTQLQNMVSYPLEDDRVVIALPGLPAGSAPEALLHYNNLLERSQSEETLEPTQGSFRPGLGGGGSR